jgi:hypothetical protein
MVLVSFTPWHFLALVAIGVFGTLHTFYKPQRRRYPQLAKLGFFLVLFDFAFETWGAVSGLWQPFGSSLLIGAQPIEVTLIAFLAGATYSLVFPRKLDLSLALFSSLLIGCTGALIEALLITGGWFAYYGPWTSWHALAGYFATFMIMHAINTQT